MLGDGPDRKAYEALAKELGVDDRVYFPGEVPFAQMADYYAYTDIFVHASLSETYGNVLGEALWCGTPTVAFSDGMGVSAQIQDGVNGVLLAPGTRDSANREGGVTVNREEEADAAYGRAVLDLIANPERRGQIGKMAAKIARERAHPRVVEQKLADAFQSAQDHAAACGLKPALSRPRPLQWYTTFRHFRPWTTVMGGIYLFGHLRPAKHEPKKDKMHPQIAT